MPRRAEHNPGFFRREYIASSYPEQLKLNLERLCARCRYRSRPTEELRCAEGLLPITTVGGDCPYYSPVAPVVPISSAPLASINRPSRP